MLRRATDYLAGLKQLRAEMDMSIEFVLEGQKLQYGHRTSVSVQRPNKIRAERVGDLVNQVLYYDGTSLTLDLPDQKYYATVAAPPTIEETLDFALEKLNLIAPASDLFYMNAFERLTEGLTSAFSSAPPPSSALPAITWPSKTRRSTGRSGSSRVKSRWCANT